MQKLKSYYAVPSRCHDFSSRILNEDILEIRILIQQQIKRQLVNTQNLICKAYAVLINVTKISLQEQNKDQMPESKEVVAKARVDIITLLR